MGTPDFGKPLFCNDMLPHNRLHFFSTGNNRLLQLLALLDAFFQLLPVATDPAGQVALLLFNIGNAALTRFVLFSQSRYLYPDERHPFPRHSQ